MIEQPSFEASAVSSNNATTTQDQASIPAFLRIPRELRDRIYSYFVTVDQHFDYVSDQPRFCSYRGDNFKDLAITRVNRQIRAEAWECLIKMNIWVSVTHTDLRDEKPDSYTWWSPQPWILYEQFPEDISRRLGHEVAIRFWSRDFFDNPSTAQPSKTFIFAYHPLAYGYFVNDIYDTLQFSPGTPIVQIRPSASLSGSRFRKLVEPLHILRDLNDVYSPDSENNANLLRLMLHNVRDLYSDPELSTTKRCLQHQCQNAELNGRLSEAMCHYWIGRHLALFHPYDDEGLPGWNSLKCMEADMAISFSRCASKHVTRLSKYTPYENIFDHDRPSILFKGVAALNEALTCPCLVDTQRRAAHLYRSLLLFHYGRLMNRLSLRGWRSPEETHGVTALNFDDLGLDSCAFEFEGDIYYFLAAKDLFYAQQVDPQHDLLATLDDDDRAVCHMIQERPGPQAFRVAEHSVPLLGIWRGDPRVWGDMSQTEHVLMKLFRQRCDELSDGDTEDYEELERQYTDLGITWHHNDDGGLLLDP